MPTPDTRVPGINRMFRMQFEPAQDCHVLLYPEGMVKLSPSAAAILGEIDGSRSVDDIIAALEKKFPGADLAADVIQFLQQAETNGWINF